MTSKSLITILLCACIYLCIFSQTYIHSLPHTHTNTHTHTHTHTHSHTYITHTQIPTYTHIPTYTLEYNSDIAVCINISYIMQVYSHCLVFFISFDINCDYI